MAAISQSKYCKLPSCMFTNALKIGDLCDSVLE